MFFLILSVSIVIDLYCFVIIMNTEGIVLLVYIMILKTQEYGLLLIWHFIPIYRKSLLMYKNHLNALLTPLSGRFTVNNTILSHLTVLYKATYQCTR